MRLVSGEVARRHGDSFWQVARCAGSAAVKGLLLRCARAPQKPTAGHCFFARSTMPALFEISFVVHGSWSKVSSPIADMETAPRVGATMGAPTKPVVGATRESMIIRVFVCDATRSGGHVSAWRRADGMAIGLHYCIAHREFNLNRRTGCTESVVWCRGRADAPSRVICM